MKKLFYNLFVKRQLYSTAATVIFGTVLVSIPEWYSDSRYTKRRGDGMVNDRQAKVLNREYEKSGNVKIYPIVFVAQILRQIIC